ncbi:MAG TPA: hypothetical protein VIJ22_10260 [Polyangiaceae bacterium]
MSAMVRLTCAAAVASALLVSSLPARAQPSVDREEERTALYRVGVAQADEGRWAAAVETFRKVIAIRSAPPALFTLGQAEEHLGHLVGAERTYEKALADARGAGNQEVVSAAQKAIAAVQARVSHVVVHLDRDARGIGADAARATLDGAGVSLGAASEVDPGDHDVIVRAPGARTFARKVRVVEGQTLDVPAVLETEGSSFAPPAPSRPAEARGSAFPLGPVILAGAGVVVGIAGYVVRAGGQSDYDAASAGCSAARCPTQSLVDSGNSGRTRMIVGTTMLGAGAGAVAGAGLWWVLGPSSTPGNQVGVALGPGDGGMRASIEGRF